MKTINESTGVESRRTSPAIPEDLGLWVGRKELLAIAYEAVQTIPWPERKTTAGEEIPVGALRTLLVYAFASGLYASADIAQSVPHDPSLGYICSNRLPEAEELRALRRAEQPSLRLALAFVVREVWQARNRQTVKSPLAGSFVLGLEAPTWVFQNDAAGRLARAVQAESASLED